MNFYETQMGQRFFSSQLPKLIQTLEKIAASLSCPPAAMKLTEMESSDILHELYCGSYEPDLFGAENETDSLSRQVMREEHALQLLLNSDAKMQFEKYQTAVSIRNSALTERAYKSGFQLAINLLLAGSFHPTPLKSENGGRQDESN